MLTKTNTKQLQVEEYSRPKDIQGMKKLIEPQILQDMTDFNKELLYSKVEKNKKME